MDSASTNYFEKLNSLFKKYNNYYILIPPSLTWSIQPLDITINGPLKKIHHWDTSFLIDYQNSRKPKNEEILDEFINILYIDNDFTREKIQKSFKVTGILNGLDGS